MKLSSLIDLYRTIRNERHIIYRIIEIATQKQQITLQIKGKNVSFKQTFDQAIHEKTLISGLSAEHACWLGVYYGRILRAAQQGRSTLRDIKNKKAISLKPGKYPYRIEFENRDGTVGYINTKNKKVFIEHPLSIVQNQYVLNQFSPNQACYIGILAGISLEKSAFRNKRKRAKMSSLTILENELIYVSLIRVC